MAGVERGFEVNLIASRNIPPVEIHTFLSHAQSLGFVLRISGEFPDLPPKPLVLETYETMVAKSPVTSLDSPVGREHFITYGDKSDVRLVTAVQLLEKIIRLAIPARRRTVDVAELMEQEKLIVGRRWDLGLEPLPEHLCGVDIMNHPILPGNSYATTAGSVIDLAKDPGALRATKGFGRGFNGALQVISRTMIRNINITLQERAHPQV